MEIARAGIFNQHQPTSIWDRDALADQDALSESTGGASEASARSTRLARLFQPPWDLMYKGEWESARDEGKEQKKWLLVDIQDPSIFDCQKLNRDLWKNEGIVETVKENFIFLQFNKDDPRASQYTQYYFQNYESPNELPTRCHRRPTDRGADQTLGTTGSSCSRFPDAAPRILGPI